MSLPPLRSFPALAVQRNLPQIRKLRALKRRRRFATASFADLSLRVCLRRHGDRRAAALPGVLWHRPLQGGRAEACASHRFFALKLPLPWVRIVSFQRGSVFLALTTWEGVIAALRDHEAIEFIGHWSFGRSAMSFPMAPLFPNGAKCAKLPPIKLPRFEVFFLLPWLSLVLLGSPWSEGSASTKPLQGHVLGELRPFYPPGL